MLRSNDSDCAPNSKYFCRIGREMHGVCNLLPFPMPLCDEKNKHMTKLCRTQIGKKII